MADYPINRGIGTPVEFKGLTSQYLFVDLGTHTLRDLLGDDGIHGFICLSLKMKTPRKDRLTGCCGILLMVSSLFE